MKVIGAGFGRTGSTSLKAALERLGFGPCYHMIEVLDRPADVELWLAAARGELTDWADLLGEFQSTTDVPGCLFWRELAETYPEAKVILSVRDPEQWYDSMERTLLRPEFQHVRDAEAPHIGVLLKAMIRRFGNAFDRGEAIAAFNRHNQAVRDGIPADRLLVHEISEGWGPLCEFLGVPVPDEPFPRLNDSESFEGNVRERLGTAK